MKATEKLHQNIREYSKLLNDCSTYVVYLDNDSVQDEEKKIYDCQSHDSYFTINFMYKVGRGAVIYNSSLTETKFFDAKNGGLSYTYKPITMLEKKNIDKLNKVLAKKIENFKKSK